MGKISWGNMLSPIYSLEKVQDETNGSKSLLSLMCERSNRGGETTVLSSIASFIINPVSNFLVDLMM